MATTELQMYQQQTVEIEEMEREVFEIESKIIDAEGHIEYRSIRGIEDAHADFNARKYIKHQKLEVKRLNTQIKNLTAQRKNLVNMTLNYYFVNICKEKMKEATFKKIIEQAQKRLDIKK